MSSPSKKRKLNSGAKQTSVPARGLEYFFAKQRKNPSSSNTSSSQESLARSSQSRDVNGDLTDEELAKRLQAEWDAEVRGSFGQNSPRPPNHSFGPAEPSMLETSTAAKPAPSPSPQVPQAVKSANTLSLSSASAVEDQITASIPLDENPLTFEPTKYIPKLQESWAAEGGEASYALLTRCFQ